MNKRTIAAFQKKLAAAGFVSWQVEAAGQWSGLRRREWRRLARRVFGVKP